MVNDYEGSIWRGECGREGGRGGEGKYNIELEFEFALYVYICEIEGKSSKLGKYN